MKPWPGPDVRNAGGSGHNKPFSALISPHGPPDAIYRTWRLARFQLVTSDVQRDEIRRASRYPKFQAILQPARVGVMVNNMQRAIVLQSLSATFATSDPDDAYLLSMAAQGQVDYLVTGDKRAGLLQRGHKERTRMVSAAGLYHLVLITWLNLRIQGDYYGKQSDTGYIYSKMFQVSIPNPTIQTNGEHDDPAQDMFEP